MADDFGPSWYNKTENKELAAEVARLHVEKWAKS